MDEEIKTEEKQKKKNTKGDKILSIIYKIFFALVIILVLLLIASKLPLPGNFQVLVVQSGSMEPAIKTGAIVVVKPVSEYKVDDVVTYRNGRRGTVPITHRIKEIKKNGTETKYVTKGDANDEIDITEVNARSVLGKVLFDIPFIGYAIAAAKKPMGFLFIIIVPALVIVYDELLKIFKEVKKIRKKEPEQESNEKT